MSNDDAIWQETERQRRAERAEQTAREGIAAAEKAIRDKAARDAAKKKP